MAKVRLSREKKKNIFLYSTEIENLFISEFLPDAPGEYVKVYLFGLMYAQFEQEPNRSELSRLLGISEEEISEAWIYWESRGLVRIERETSPEGEEEYSIVFPSRVEELYGRAPESGTDAEYASAAEEAGGSEEDDIPIYLSIDDMDYDAIISEKIVDRRLRGLYEKYQSETGRTISRRDTSKIEEAIKVYGIEPEIFDFAIDYCTDLEKYSVDYIFKVALRWTEEGCRTVEDAKRLLDKHSLRNSWYSQVFRALGFNRPPAPADREIMDRWFDEMGFSIGDVLDACNASAGLRDPNLRYVNKVLENRVLEKGGVNTKAPKPKEGQSGEGGMVSRKVLADYFEYIRTNDEEARQARISEVLGKVPAMKDVFGAENSVNARLLSIRPDPGNLDERQRLRAERIGIEERKKELLTENGYPADYLNRKFRCEKCRDTGITDEGMVCGCCRQRAAEAYEWYTDKNKA